MKSNNLKILFSSRHKRLALEVLVVLAGKVAVLAGTLALVKVLTERLTPAEYGVVALALSLAAASNFFIFGGIISGIARTYSIAQSSADLPRYFRACTTLFFLATLPIMATAIIASNLVPVMSNWKGLVLPVTLLALLMGINDIGLSIHNAARNRATVALHRGIEVWLKVGILLAHFHSFSSSTAAVIVTYTTSVLFCLLSHIWLLRKLIPSPKIDLTPKKQSPINWVARVWRISWPVTLFGPFMWLQTFSDRWSLDYFSNSGAVGMYAVLYQLGFSPMQMLQSIFSQFSAPIIFNRAKDGSNSSLLNSSNNLVFVVTAISFVVTIFVTIFMYFAHGTIFKLLVAEEYHAVSKLLPLLTLAAGIFGTAQLLSTTFLIKEKATMLITPNIIAALVGVAFVVIGAAYFSILGVALAQVAYSLVYLLLIFVRILRFQSSASTANSQNPT